MTRPHKLMVILLGLGGIALCVAAFEWSMLWLVQAPRPVSCEALVQRPVPRWVTAAGCSVDLQRAFVTYEGDAAIAHAQVLPRNPRGEVDVLLVSRDAALVEAVLDPRRRDTLVLPELVASRWDTAPDGDALRALQARHSGLARHTTWILHDQPPRRDRAVRASAAAVGALVPGLALLLWRRWRGSRASPPSGL